MDEELAEQVAKEPPVKSKGVRMRDWSVEMDILAAAVDRLGDVVQAVIASQGGKPPVIKPLERPVTALEKLRNDPRREHFRVLSKVRIAQPDGSVAVASDLNGALDLSAYTTA